MAKACKSTIRKNKPKKPVFDDGINIHHNQFDVKKTRLWEAIKNGTLLSYK